jgi:hypothetical protein
LAPLRVCLINRDGLLEQQPQPAPCEALYSPTVFGALALRSLVVWALRLLAGIEELIKLGQI